MLWIGGELTIPGISALAHNIQGLQAILPYTEAITHTVHHIAHVAESIGGGALGWLAEAAANAAVGLGVGSTIIGAEAIIHRTQKTVNVGFDHLDRVPGMDTPKPISFAAFSDVDGEFLGLPSVLPVFKCAGSGEETALSISPPQPRELALRNDGPRL